MSISFCCLFGLFCFVFTRHGVSNSNRSPEMAFPIFPSSPFSSSPPPQDRRKLGLWLISQSRVHWDTSGILNGVTVVNLADDSWAKELVTYLLMSSSPKPFMTLADVQTEQSCILLLQSPKPTMSQWKSAKQCDTHS